MAEDRRTSGFVGTSGSTEAFLFVPTNLLRGFRHTRNTASSSFDDPSFDPRLANTFGQFPHVDFGDGIRGKSPKMRRNTECFIVETRRHNHPDAGLLSGFGGKFWVTTKFHRTRINDGIHS